MAYETKDNTGSLFRNDRKTSDTHADYTGSARIDGHDVWVNAWINKDKNGNSYMKLGFKRKDGTAERPEQKEAEFKAAAKKAFNLDDEVPF
jgi:hypothetical protein